MAVKIYIHSGIRTLKHGHGKIGYVTEPDGVGRISERYNVNMYQAEMLALYMALQEADMKGGTGVIDIYTDCAYISRALTSTVPKAADTGWHNNRGEPIKNADAWKAIWEHVKGREYIVHLNEDHEYRKWLIENTTR